MSTQFLQCQTHSAADGGHLAFVTVAQNAFQENSFTALIDTGSAFTYVPQELVSGWFNVQRTDSTPELVHLDGWDLTCRTCAVSLFLHDEAAIVEVKTIVRIIEEASPRASQAPPLRPVLGVSIFSPCGGLRFEVPELGTPLAVLEVEGELRYPAIMG